MHGTRLPFLGVTIPRGRHSQEPECKFGIFDHTSGLVLGLGMVNRNHMHRCKRHSDKN